MKQLLILSALAFTLLACDPEPAATTAPATPTTEEITPAKPDLTDRTYVPGERVGLITGEMTAENVRAIYGADQFVAATLNGPEGITYPGFHLFPGTDDELSIALDSSGFYAHTYRPGSHWASAGHGVRVGTSLEELVRLNGRPFSFSGFGWDYGGNVTDWQGGELEGHRVRLTYDENSIYEEDRAFMSNALGDQIVSSDNTHLENKGIRVNQVSMTSD